MPVVPPVDAPLLSPPARDLLERARLLLKAPPDPRTSVLAVELCGRVLAEAPGHPEASVLAARALHAHCRHDEATAVCDAALERYPGAAEVRLAQLVYTIPSVYRDAAEVRLSRAAYERRLEALERRLADAPDAESARLVTASRRISSYWLPFQAQNDAELQRRLGGLLRRSLLAAYGRAAEEPEQAAPPGSDPGTPARPLRVGFVSDQFFSHTVWHMVIRGWLTGLRDRGVACHAYAIGGREDECTAATRDACVRFASGPRTVPEWCELIRADGPDVLVYPALSYSVTVDALAHARLAPVQCTTLGHCETSGSPVMDYFLGSELMEPADGDAHYTERLVRLPELGLPWTPPPVDPGPGCDIPGLRPGATLLLSPHEAKKYLPGDDALYGRIAREAPDAQLVFVRDPRVRAVSALLERRLTAALAACGADPERQLVFIDRLPREGYEALLARTDVYLDVPGWNGGTTSAGALARHVPMVTLEGVMARGRMGAAMLRHLGLTEGLARTPDDYVAAVAGLARDAERRRALCGRLAAASSRLGDDTRRTDALAAFFEQAVRDARAAGSPQRGREA